MTIDWLQTWIIPFFWVIIDAVWLVVSILFFRIVGGKTSVALIIAASYSLLISCLSTADSFLSNLTTKPPFIEYDNPLYFILLDVSWPFSLFCIAIFMGIATFRIQAIVRRNKELENLVAASLTSSPTVPAQRK